MSELFLFDIHRGDGSPFIVFNPLYPHSCVMFLYPVSVCHKLGDETVSFYYFIDVYILI